MLFFLAETETAAIIQLPSAKLRTNEKAMLPKFFCNTNQSLTFVNQHSLNTPKYGQASPAAYTAN